MPLNSDGNAWNGLATADPPDRALVTTKSGEYLRFNGERRKVLAVEVYRATGQV